MESGYAKGFWSECFQLEPIVGWAKAEFLCARGREQCGGADKSKGWTRFYIV